MATIYLVLTLALTCQSPADPPVPGSWVKASDGRFYWGYIDATNRIQWSHTLDEVRAAERTPRVLSTHREAGDAVARNYGVMKEPRHSQFEGTPNGSLAEGGVRITADSNASAAKVATILGLDHECADGSNCPGPNCPNRPKKPAPEPLPLPTSASSVPWLTVLGLIAAAAGVLVLVRKFAGRVA